MYDSLFIKCPRCGKELQFQSKSGPCFLSCYNKSNISIDVAIGMNGDIAECQFCGINFRLECNIPKKVKIKLIRTKSKARYPGNYNPDLLKNKERIKKMIKLLKKED